MNNRPNSNDARPQVTALSAEGVTTFPARVIRRATGTTPVTIFAFVAENPVPAGAVLVLGAENR